MKTFREIAENTEGVLITKQIGQDENESDAPSIYRIHLDPFDEDDYSIEIFRCWYDGYYEGSAIFEKDFSSKNKLNWDEIKEKCFSEEWHTDIEEHKQFIDFLNNN